jgi:putative transcriptional regulator
MDALRYTSRRRRGYHDAMTLPTSQPRPRRLFALLAVAAAALAAPLAAQSVGNGTLLVASPGLTDPNFARSVVLVLRNDDNGTLGVVLNRPTNLEPATVFPELATGVGTYSGRLFRGGPNSPAQVLLLVRGLAAATISTPEILDKVFLTIDVDSLPEMVRLADGTNDLRIYAGHAAWGPGQLDAELRAGGWQVLPGTADLVFHTDPSDLWTELEGRGTTRSDLVASLRGNTGT